MPRRCGSACCTNAWRWGLADRQVEALLPNLKAATRWLTEPAAPDGDGLLKYLDSSGTGLANQGWKDSSGAIRWRGGHLVDGPIALCEAQAYAIEAASAAAALFAHFNVDGAADLLDYAGQMRARFRERFWVGAGDDRFIGLAVDGDGKTVDGLGSNMGHVLGTGTLNAREVDRVARTLTSPELLSRYGISTLARDNAGFNPIGYHSGSIWTHDTAICAWGLAREGKRARLRTGRARGQAHPATGPAGVIRADDDPRAEVRRTVLRRVVCRRREHRAAGRAGRRRDRDSMIGTRHRLEGPVR